MNAMTNRELVQRAIARGEITPAAAPGCLNPPRHKKQPELRPARTPRGEKARASWTPEKRAAFGLRMRAMWTPEARAVAAERQRETLARARAAKAEKRRNAA
jgi:hypothetical protein